MPDSAALSASSSGKEAPRRKLNALRACNSMYEGSAMSPGSAMHGISKCAALQISNKGLASETWEPYYLANSHYEDRRAAIRVHAYRAVGSYRHYRDSRWIASASAGPGQGEGASDQLHEQPSAIGNCLDVLPG